MPRLVMQLLATFAVAGLSVGAASAAPVSSAVYHVGAGAPSLVQPVHWEWHHHHRVWVRDHRR